MSKRFTSSEKWQDAWYRKLPPRLKCLWDWLYTQCDIAGTISPDWELASFQIGEKCDANDLKVFENRIKELSGGRLFLKDFIRFQYGNLTDKCPAHRPVIALLDRLLIDYSIPINREQEKEKEKDCININENTVDKSKVFQALPENLKEPIRQYVKVYNFNHGKLHEGQFDLMLQGMLRIPKDSRIESIALSTMKKHKFICDCRNDFSKLATVSETRTETKKEAFREFGGIYAD